MRTVQLLIVAMLATILLVPAAAQAARDPLGSQPVRVRPLKPVATDTLTVSFTAGKLKPDERYLVGFSSGENVACTPGYTVRLRRQTPGRLVRVRLTPDIRFPTGKVIDPPASNSLQRFCAVSDDIMLTAINADGKIRFLGHRRFTIAKDAGYPSPSDTPVSIGVLPGSGVTVRRAGQPDRTLALTGQLRGAVPGLIQLGRDISIGQIGGNLSLPVIEPDAACAGPRYRTSFAPWRDASLVLMQSGDATFTLPLDVDPASLAGCNEPSAPGRTALTLTGKVGEGGLTRLAVSGTLSGATLAPGVTADLTVNLFLNVDLSGRG